MKLKEEKDKCYMCKKEIKGTERYLYFDPSNIAITKSMSKSFFCSKECVKRFEKGERND